MPSKRPSKAKAARPLKRSTQRARCAHPSGQAAFPPKTRVYFLNQGSEASQGWMRRSRRAAMTEMAITIAMTSPT